MKLIYVSLALLLGACQSFAPTAVNPGVTYVTNDLKAVTAAGAGVCNIPIVPPSGSNVAIDCAPLDASVTTVDQNKTTYEQCFTDAASTVVGKRISGAAQLLQAQLCAQQGQTVGPAPAPPAPAVVKPLK
jgi:hypothetical protein